MKNSVYVLVVLLLGFMPAACSKRAASDQSNSKSTRLVVETDSLLTTNRWVRRRKSDGVIDSTNEVIRRGESVILRMSSGPVVLKRIRAIGLGMRMGQAFSPHFSGDGSWGFTP